MKKLSFLVVVAFLSCQQQQSDKTVEGEDAGPKYVLTNDTIPKVRTSPKKAAVSQFSQKVPDDLNNWAFSVAAYETKQTFSYLMKMKYKEFEAEDIVELPDFGTHPKIEIRKGDQDFTAIVGFLDKNKEFKPYKKVVANGNQLKVSTIRHYRRGIFVKKAD